GLRVDRPRGTDGGRRDDERDRRRSRVPDGLRQGPAGEAGRALRAPVHECAALELRARGTHPDPESHPDGDAEGEPLMADTCDLPPFRYQSVPQTDPVTGASSNQVNEQSLEEWLASLLTRVCDDLQAIEA